MTRVDRIFNATLQLSTREREELQARFQELREKDTRLTKGKVQEPAPKPIPDPQLVPVPTPPPPLPQPETQPEPEPEAESEPEVPATSASLHLSAAQKALAEKQKSVN